jgi:hypothetical protein
MTTLNNAGVAARWRAFASAQSNGRFEPVNAIRERPLG